VSAATAAAVKPWPAGTEVEARKALIHSGRVSVCRSGSAGTVGGPLVGGPEKLASGPAPKTAP
jgi:hypothetical protein